MFRTDNEKILFSKHGWFDVAEHQKAKLKEQVAGIDGNRLLNTSIDDLCAYLVKEFSVNVPTLKRDDIVADQRETQIDVRYDPRRWIDDKSRPVYVTGAEIEITIPFDGDETVFKVQPTTFSLDPPRGHVQRGHLHIIINGTDLTAEKVRSEIDNTLDQIEKCLQTLRGNSLGLANELPAIARQVIESRREKLLANQSLVSSLGFKMKARDDSPRTYTAPECGEKSNRHCRLPVQLRTNLSHCSRIPITNISSVSSTAWPTLWKDRLRRSQRSMKKTCEHIFSFS